MAHDLIRGCTNTSWSRGSFVGQEETAKTPLTDAEKTRIEKLALVEMKASQGDLEAQKLIVKINVALNDLGRKAKKGDAKAIRTLDTLKESGLITKIATTSSKSSPRLAMAGGKTESGYNGHWRFSRPQLSEEDHALATEAGSSERDAVFRHHGVLKVGLEKQSRLPKIFQYTAYRIPSVADLDEIHACNLSSDQVLSGFTYTIVGRGITTKKNIQDIITSIDLLNRRHPDPRYQVALVRARKLTPYHAL